MTKSSFFVVGMPWNASISRSHDVMSSFSATIISVGVSRMRRTYGKTV